MISGQLMYEERHYSFELDENTFVLTLHPLDSEMGVFFNPLEFLLEGRTDNRKSPIWLIGEEYETDRQLLFVVKHIQTKTRRDYRHSETKTTLIARVEIYIHFESREFFSSPDEIKERLDVNAISFEGPEVDGFFPVVPYEISGMNKDGTIALNVRDYGNTSEKFSFQYREDKTIETLLSILRKAKYGSRNPLQFSRRLTHSFESTSDLTFLENLILDTRKVFMFLTYRKNVHFESISLKRGEMGELETVGQVFMRFYGGERVEESSKIEKRIIDHTLIGQQMPKLFELISKDQIYMGHVPESLKESWYITNGRYVMAVAGFEAQYKKVKGDSSVQTESHIQREKAKEELILELEKKLEDIKGKKHQKKSKKMYQGIITHLQSDKRSLEDKIEEAFSKNRPVMDYFLKHLYEDLNGVDVDSQSLGERIAKHRNKFAHGDLDFEAYELYILDFWSIKWLYYAMVLTELGMSEKSIYDSINKLFDRRLVSYDYLSSDENSQEKTHEPNKDT
ncbi:hypothetical protein EXIGUO8H_100008 [Exiguobacterium sp. 8H]|uniref:HEPN domain-containing protein n=1 Tax=unclassified Exiguobacterium TaxID=2644629 RepID=UPI0012F1C764|nr:MULTISPECIES: HEPN domain-containing protein [unclassified Exiguobacterium]VXB37728.1 hypothetical protein EXIGUO8H_100008 [Exiguobacterium sp. 8H]VXB92350.1 hypothetical protein EXIGUO8A_250006 [Exiguobacterium sp. 8A]